MIATFCILVAILDCRFLRAAVVAANDSRTNCTTTLSSSWHGKGGGLEAALAGMNESTGFFELLALAPENLAANF